MTYHPELTAARFFPRGGPRSLRSLRRTRALASLLERFNPGTGERVVLRDGGALQLHVPAAAPEPRPALLWIHGGGMVAGSPAADSEFCERVCNELGIVVASVDYRLAPEHPFPTPLEDCYRGLLWLADRADVDAARVAVGGASAGGGLAAGLVLLARQRRHVQPAFQLLAYPMLDDRTARRTDISNPYIRMWDQRSNSFGWQSYLGALWEAENVPATAAPAREENLAGIAPAWIGVGSHDLFFDEDVSYARRLREAGVPVDLVEVDGAYHAFDGAQPRKQISQQFKAAQVDALRRALLPGRRLI